MIIQIPNKKNKFNNKRMMEDFSKIKESDILNKEVILLLPKFKFESEIDLINPLKKVCIN